MTPKNFPQANTDMRGDHLEVDGKQVGNLRIFHDKEDGVMVSCWRPSFRERLHMLFNGEVWLHQYTNGFPPTSIATEISWEESQ